MQQKRIPYEPAEKPISRWDKQNLFLGYLKQFNEEILIDLSKMPLEIYNEADCPSPKIFPFDELELLNGSSNITQRSRLKESLQGWANKYNLSAGWILDTAYRTLEKWTRFQNSLQKLTWASVEPVSYYIPSVPLPKGFPEYHFVDGETRKQYLEKIESLAIETFNKSALLVPENVDFPEREITRYIKKTILPVANKYCDELEQETKEWGYSKMPGISKENIKHVALRYAKGLSKSRLAKEVYPTLPEYKIQILAPTLYREVLRTAKYLELPPYPRGKTKGTRNTRRA